MANNISTLAKGQISEKLQVSSPTYVAFLELYYKYAQLRNNSIGVIQNHSDDSDIDLTLDEYVSRFYAVYGQDVPSSTTLDRRTLIKLLNDIYSAKGTEKAFSLLFRVLFNIDTDYFKPSNQILIASSGKWVQESFITLSKTYGDFAALAGNDILVDTESGIFSFTPIRYEVLDAGTARVFFKTSSLINFDATSRIEVKDSTGQTILLCELILAPSRIRIVAKGNNFQAGQIYTVPGTVKPTIFKISRVSTGGKIEGIEIIEFGHNHVQNEQSWISSYKSTPPSTGVFAITTETSPGIFLHEIGITEVIYNISENISGYSLGIGTGSYFLEDYVQIDYNGDFVFDREIGGIPTSPIYGNTPQISLSQYLADRAKIELQFDIVSNMLGKYTDNGGHLSDPYMKLQDNYYYQLFSYVVSSSIDVSKYKYSILKMLHPAGLKAFTSVTKTADINIIASITVDSVHS